MSLFSRITANDSTKISVHRFGAALREWSSGGVTRQNIIDRFALSAGEVTELDALAATYNAMTTGNAANAFAKAVYISRMEDVFILCETGDYTEAQAKARLGF
jgi:hypothetical protein